MDILRDGDKKNISLILAELPDQFRGQATFHDNNGVLGEMTIAPLNDLTQEKYEIHERVKTGVVLLQKLRRGVLQNRQD